MNRGRHMGGKQQSAITFTQDLVAKSKRILKKYNSPNILVIDLINAGEKQVRRLIPKDLDYERIESPVQLDEFFDFLARGDREQLNVLVYILEELYSDAAYPGGNCKIVMIGAVKGEIKEIVA